MGWLTTLDRWVRRICTVLGVFGAISIVCMQLLITFDVILRDTINRPIRGSFEITEYLMIIAVSCAFGITQVNRFHISVTVVVDRLPKRWRAALDTLTLLVVFAFLAAACWIGFDQVLQTAKRSATSQVLMIIRWPFQAMVVVGFASFALAIAKDVLIAFMSALGKDVTLKGTQVAQEELRTT